MDWKTEFHTFCLEFDIEPEKVRLIESLGESLNKHFFSRLKDEYGYTLSQIKPAHDLANVFLSLHYIIQGLKLSLSVMPKGEPHVSMILFKDVEKRAYGDEIMIDEAMLGKRKIMRGTPTYPEFNINSYKGKDIDEKVQSFTEWFFSNLPDKLKDCLSGKSWTSEFAFDRDNY